MGGAECTPNLRQNATKLFSPVKLSARRGSRAYQLNLSELSATVQKWFVLPISLLHQLLEAIVLPRPLMRPFMNVARYSY